MNISDIKQQIVYACMQKAAKGFNSRLKYCPAISIFPDCWTLTTEDAVEPEFVWNNLLVSSKCLNEPLNITSKSTQTDEIKSLHSTFKSQTDHKLHYNESSKEFTDQSKQKSRKRVMISILINRNIHLRTSSLRLNCFRKRMRNKQD